MPKSKSLKKRGGSCQVNNPISKSPCFDVDVSQYKSPCKHLPLDKDFVSQTGGKKSVRKNKKSLKKRKQKGGTLTLKNGSGFSIYLSNQRTSHLRNSDTGEISTPIVEGGVLKTTLGDKKITLIVSKTHSGCIYISVHEGHTKVLEEVDSKPPDLGTELIIRDSSGFKTYYSSKGTVHLYKSDEEISTSIVDRGCLRTNFNGKNITIIVNKTFTDSIYISVHKGNSKNPYAETKMPKRIEKAALEKGIITSNNKYYK